MNRVPVTAIIPVHNGEDSLGECLRSLSASHRVPTEIIVVDDGSSDNSARIAWLEGARVIQIAERSGPATARNLGANAANSPYLLFVDADVAVHPDAVERAWQALDGHPESGAAFGSYDSNPSSSGFVSQFRNLLHHFTHSVSHSDASTFWAAFGIVRREEFLRHGGFDESYAHPSVEDIELGMRMSRAGMQIKLDRGMQVCHAKHWTLGSVVHTDIFRRAWPWSKLLLRHGGMKDDLNLRWSQRLSAGFAWAAVVAGFISIFHPQFLLGLLFGAAAVVGTNLPFLGYLRRIRGLTFSIRAFPMVFLYLLYSSATFALAAACHASQSLSEPVVSPIPKPTETGI